ERRAVGGSPRRTLHRELREPRRTLQVAPFVAQRIREPLADRRIVRATVERFGVGDDRIGPARLLLLVASLLQLRVDEELACFFEARFGVALRARIVGVLERESIVVRRRDAVAREKSLLRVGEDLLRLGLHRRTTTGVETRG